MTARGFLRAAAAPVGIGLLAGWATRRATPSKLWAGLACTVAGLTVWLTVDDRNQNHRFEGGLSDPRRISHLGHRDLNVLATDIANDIRSGGTTPNGGLQ